MRKTGVVNLPLHTGHTPAWLFDRMKALSLNILEYMVCELGEIEVLKRLSDPFWFQCFGCVLGFDWHSSGITTTCCGALKEATKKADLGIYVCGGKGKVARKTPDEIRRYERVLNVDPEDLIGISRIVAKVDTCALQDGFDLYHHVIFFTKDGHWCVIQQGMNKDTRYARRYHWIYKKNLDFVDEPHSAICSDASFCTLNLCAKESQKARNTVVSISRDDPKKTADTFVSLNLPSHHFISEKDINPKRLKSILYSTYANPPKDFCDLLLKKGVGPKTIRALSLISELVYGNSPSFRDPARFSFAHGGKDGHPYRINIRDYEKTIEVLEKGIKKSKVGDYEIKRALLRLYHFIKE